MRGFMRWLISFVVFGTIVAGFFHTSLASDTKKQGSHDIGVHQPPVVREKGMIPGKVTLSQPKALAKISGNSVALKWEKMDGVVYHVQVAKDPRYKWIVTENHEVSGESFEVSNLEAGQQYFWRVAARKPGNDAGYTKGAFTASSFETP